MELKAKEIESLIEQDLPTLIIGTAKYCPHCTELKTHIDDIKKLANSNNINLALISIEDQDNKEFFERYPFETLPYCLVFVNKEFKGGDETSKEMLEQIIPMISSTIKREKNE